MTDTLISNVQLVNHEQQVWWGDGPQVWQTTECLWVLSHPPPQKKNSCFILEVYKFKGALNFTPESQFYHHTDYYNEKSFIMASTTWLLWFDMQMGEPNVMC